MPIFLIFINSLKLTQKEIKFFQFIVLLFQGLKLTRTKVILDLNSFVVVRIVTIDFSSTRSLQPLL